MTAPAKRGHCSACGAKVTWAAFPDRAVRPIESCPDGEGTVALQPVLPGLGPLGRIEARIVSGVRTAYRLHLEKCPRASVFRNRFRIELCCRSCSVPMATLENGRSLCAVCQEIERARLVELAAHMTARLGVDGAHQVIAGVAMEAEGRARMGKR